VTKKAGLRGSFGNPAPFFLFFAFVLAFSACANSPPAGPQRQAPEWVRDPYIRFNRQTYVAAVGMGSSRELAERSAMGNLVAIFGQRIELDERITSHYQEAVRSGAAASWSQDITVETVISRAAEMDTLVGAEIGETWRNAIGDYYAAAVLNRARAVQFYSELVRANQTLINNLVNIPAAERNTLEGFARFQLAATIADVTAPYANLLSFLGAPVHGFPLGGNLRLEAVNITRAIPIGITVQNDMAGRIHGAFARAFSELGFRSGGRDSRYMLDVNIIASPVIITGSPFYWTRIEVSANLRDTATGTVLLPFHFNLREGHTSQAEADNRAYAAAERRINEQYTGLLSAYLSQLMPRR